MATLLNFFPVANPYPHNPDINSHGLGEGEGWSRALPVGSRVGGIGVTLLYQGPSQGMGDSKPAFLVATAEDLMPLAMGMDGGLPRGGLATLITAIG